MFFYVGGHYWVMWTTSLETDANINITGNFTKNVTSNIRLIAIGDSPGVLFWLGPLVILFRQHHSFSNPFHPCSERWVLKVKNEFEYCLRFTAIVDNCFLVQCYWNVDAIIFISASSSSHLSLSPSHHRHHHHHIILILIINCRKVLQTSEEKRVPSLNRFLSGLASTPPNQSNIITCTIFSSQTIQSGKEETRIIGHEHIWINLKRKKHAYI